MCELIINDKFWGLVIIWTVFCRKQESKRWKEHRTNIIKPNVFQEMLNIYFKILVYFWFWNRAKWILHQIEFIYLFYIHVIAIRGTFFFKNHIDMHDFFYIMCEITFELITVFPGIHRLQTKNTDRYMPIFMTIIFHMYNFDLYCYIFSHFYLFLFLCW